MKNLDYYKKSLSFSMNSKQAEKRSFFQNLQFFFFFILKKKIGLIQYNIDNYLSGKSKKKKNNKKYLVLNTLY